MKTLQNIPLPIGFRNIDGPRHQFEVLYTCMASFDPENDGPQVCRDLIMGLDWIQNECDWTFDAQVIDDYYLHMGVVEFNDDDIIRLGGDPETLDPKEFVFMLLNGALGPNPFGNERTQKRLVREKGHTSMSVGDILVEWVDGEPTFWFCDRVGFDKIDVPIK